MSEGVRVQRRWGIFETDLWVPTFEEMSFEPRLHWDMSSFALKKGMHPCPGPKWIRKHRGVDMPAGSHSLARKWQVGIALTLIYVPLLLPGCTLA